MKNILHISTDSIFMDHVIEQFEEIKPSISDYFIFSDSINNVRNNKYITHLPYKEYFSEKIHKKLSNYKCVILHPLTKEHVYLINKSNKNIRFLWLMWGADGLYNKKFGSRWYSKGTTLVLNKNKKEKTVLQKLNNFISSTFLFELIYVLRKKKWSYDWSLKKAIKKINYIAPVIEEDYHLLKEKFKTKAKFIQFSLGSLKTLLNGQKFDIKYNQNNILLGNSADPSNNHIDILNLLHKINFNGKIICPLSYGNHDYSEQIKLEGKSLFGANFVPLIDFLPIKQYQEIINSCGIVVMNHFRQQAMGNIISALYQGKKVFLNENNYSNNFFSLLNIKVYSVQKDLKSTIENNDIIEENNIIIRNRLNLEKYYSHEEVLEKTRKLIELIT